MTEKEMLADIGEQLYSATKFMKERGVLDEFHRWCSKQAAERKAMFARFAVAIEAPAD